MTLTLRVLGCDTPYPRPGRPCSGYLVDASGTLLVLELGHAVWPELLRYADPKSLAAVWISHLHPDHCVDLFAAYQWAANTDGARRLSVYGPPGWVARLGAALPGDDGPARLRRLFDVHEHDREPVRVGEVELAAVPVCHSVPTYGLRLTHHGRVLAFSGDSGACPALATLAAGADVFLCEAGSTEPGQPYHCTPEEAAEIGSSARRLVLTHLAPGLAAEDTSRRATGATVAQPGVIIDCGS